MDTASEDSGGPSRRWAAIRDALIDHPDVERKQILMMARQIRVDAITRVVFGGFISLSIGLPSMLGTEASSAEATTWFAMFVVLSPVMFLTGQSLLWRDPATFPLRYWRLVFFVLYGANGILWSLLLLFGWTDGSVATQAFVLIVIVAHLTTYLVNLGAHLLTFITTSITVTVFCEILLWHQGSELATITRIIFPMFGIYLLVLGYDANRRLGVSLRRGMELECLADELEIARAAAVAEGRARSRFFASMSHELRTPLNAIIGFAELMVHRISGPLGSDRYDEYARDIARSGNHLLRLVNDLLDLSSAQHERMQINRTRVSIAELFDETRSALAQLAEESRVQFIVRMEPGLTANLDQIRMVQVLVNIGTNAIRFSDPGGHVLLQAASRPNDTLVLSIQDEGMGITPDDLAQIADPFQKRKRNDVTSSHGPGNGRGVAVAREMLELHGGSLRIESEIGLGTNVTMTIPSARLEQVKAP